ncbi:hypothetical protein NPIL_364451 [Nephila pilipes]|uniref:Uncharacterized protein n=1 Tax=Nephila pilipes TaxID=299642 RepID=A0A8X6R2E4_NEPPI|nr:hypothetical protein NPIL_364451 [Nephila pilipes]
MYVRKVKETVGDEPRLDRPSTIVTAYNIDSRPFPVLRHTHWLSSRRKHLRTLKEVLLMRVSNIQPLCKPFSQEMKNDTTNMIQYHCKKIMEWCSQTSKRLKKIPYRSPESRYSWLRFSTTSSFTKNWSWKSKPSTPNSMKRESNVFAHICTGRNVKSVA